MELSQLEVFLAVAREHRFSRAAEKLYRTQSAVSQTIRKLEDELGEALFDRSSREGVLTDAGNGAPSSTSPGKNLSPRGDGGTPGAGTALASVWLRVNFLDVLEAYRHFIAASEKLVLGDCAIRDALGMANEAKAKQPTGFADTFLRAIKLGP